MTDCRNSGIVLVMSAAKEDREYKSLLRKVYLRAPAGKKWCPQCKRMLDKSKFKANSHRKDGLRSWCMECERGDVKERARKRQGYYDRHKKEE